MNESGKTRSVDHFQCSVMLIIKLKSSSCQSICVSRAVLGGV